MLVLSVLYLVVERGGRGQFGNKIVQYNFIAI